MKKPGTNVPGFQLGSSQGIQDFADTLHGALITQNLHNSVQIRGVGLASGSLADYGMSNPCLRRNNIVPFMRR